MDRALGVLSDPLRLGLLLGFGPEEARAARTAARAVAGCRAAIVVRSAARVAAPSADGSPKGDAPVVLVGADGRERPLDERVDPPPPGALAAIRGAAGDRSGLVDRRTGQRRRNGGPQLLRVGEILHAAESDGVPGSDHDGSCDATSGLTGGLGDPCTEGRDAEAKGSGTKPLTSCIAS